MPRTVLFWIIVAGLAAPGCGSDTADEPKTPWNTEKCAPGNQRVCQCDDESGLQECDSYGIWSACDCSGDVTASPDTLLPGDAKSVAPTSANLPANGSPVAGVGRLVSENYELQIVIGPTSPISSVGGEKYEVQLGPVGIRSSRKE